MMADQHTAELPPQKEHFKAATTSKRKPRATHIIKTTRGNNHKRKKTALQ
jgi:hypothetical protein